VGLRLALAVLVSHYYAMQVRDTMLGYATGSGGPTRVLVRYIAKLPRNFATDRERFDLVNGGLRGIMAVLISPALGIDVLG
jgi:hypothetical protein